MDNKKYINRILETGKYHTRLQVALTRWPASEIRAAETHTTHTKALAARTDDHNP